MTMLSIALIRRDSDLQSRASFDARTVIEYTEAAQQGREFVPVVVFFDGTTYWLGDGFHRVRGFQDAGLLEVPAEVREGTKRDAKRYSKGANDHPQNGLRRTDADKRKIVLDCLEDEEWKEWSNVAIAELCGVSPDFVRRIRDESAQVASKQPAHKSGSNTGTSKRKGKDGKMYPAKKAAREQKAPLSPTSQNGAISNLLPNPSNDESTEPVPLPHEEKTEHSESSDTATTPENEHLRQQGSENGEIENSNSPNSPVSFGTTHDLCLFLSQNGPLLQRDSNVFWWVIGEAERLSQ